MTLTFFALHNPQSKSLRDFASSLDAKTQFVASYAPRETVGRANVALRRREHIKVGELRTLILNRAYYISPERGGDYERQRVDGRVAA